jgi:hypothetical protein
MEMIKKLVKTLDRSDIFASIRSRFQTVVIPPSYSHAGGKAVIRSHTKAIRTMGRENVQVESEFVERM